MKNLKRICKYFIITFAIVLVCGFIGIVIKEVGKDTFYKLDIKEALSYCTQLGLTAFTALIPYSLSVATFLTFWAMNSSKWKDFFRTLAIGLIIVLPLSATTYYYDWFIRPQIMATSAEKLIEIKSMYPESLADEFNIDKKQILNQIPMAMPKRTLIIQMDSLGTSFQTDAATCGQLLSSLPDSLALDAYQSYQLKKMGIAYQYTTHPAADKDSLMYIQRRVLYQKATQSWDTLTELQRYRKEFYGRTINTVNIYIIYLVFALTGYLLRYKPIKKILAILAILIVSAYISNEINSIIQIHAQKVKVVSKQVVDKTREEIREQRKGTPSETNQLPT